MQISKLLLAAAALAIVSGCTTSVPAPVQDRTARPTQPPQPQILPPAPIAVMPVNPALPGNTAGSKFHVVQRGETLYGIARVNKVDINELAAWNNIFTTQPLRDGQVLRLQPPTDPSTSTSGMPLPVAPSATLTPIPSAGVIQGQALPPGGLPPSGPSPVFSPVAPVETPVDALLKREPKSQRVQYSDASLAVMKQGEGTPASPPPLTGSGPASVTNVPPPLGAVTPVPAPATPIEIEIRPGTGVEHDGIAWTWPTSGKVASKFNDKAPMKGIDIAASAGTPVVAAAAGKVIYVGKEPRGYGQMIVISHAKETVSVYFHTDKLLVKEQQRVLIGQKLAEVGDSAGNKMHFEVRRQGRPLDPVSLMPR
ncbi:MAG: peptidoglycan DD-metalloendopeptidase family protein [Casimicrobium sp.]|jgi:lipoprotein NlpD